jgi:hypothetical protein
MKQKALKKVTRKTLKSLKSKAQKLSNQNQPIKERLKPKMNKKVKKNEIYFILISNKSSC